MHVTDFSFREEFRTSVAANLGRFVRSASLDGERHAAVSVMIVELDDGTAGFVITRRSLKLKNHRGQWALPGGGIDAGETVEEAALREVTEEVGVRLGQDAILGRLDDYATRSGFVISPVIMWAGAVELVANPDEVDLVLPLPLADLDRHDAPVFRRIPESDRPVIMMPLMDHMVFAPTAAILYQFREVALRGLNTRVAHFEQPVFAWR